MAGLIAGLARVGNDSEAPIRWRVKSDSGN